MFTEIQLPRISEPGAIRLEYEAELKRLQEERLRLDEKHFYETELLIGYSIKLFTYTILALNI